MYAIVEMQGFQYRVEAGKKLFVNRLDAEKGAEVTFEKVLLVDNNGEVKVGAPVVEGAKVICEVLDNECRGEKVDRKSTRLNSSHNASSRMPSSA